ncbi:MAG: hypothetical protein IJF21_03265 [Clostridia bacterium]|nr:hypothetical protein [Clostridia bacterium]
MVYRAAERYRAEQAQAANDAASGAVGNRNANGYNGNRNNSSAQQQEKTWWENLVEGLKDLFNIENPEPTPTSTPSTTPSATPVTLDILPETTPAPMTPTPSPTPSPTPDFDSIRRETISQLIAAGRKLNKPFFTAYSQEVGARKDCSVQIFNLYKEIRGEKEVPFPPNTNMTCEELYKKFANNVPEGWTIYSNVPYVERRGSLAVPVDWEKVANAGDIVIFKEDLEFTDSGDIKDNKGEWHVGLCLGNGQMLDRTKWEENNPSGKPETGLFCRGLDTMPQDDEVVMIIDPGDAALTPEEIERYLINPPDINTIHERP